MRPLPARTVVLFGSQQITVDTLHGLVARGLRVAAVVTQRRPSDAVFGYASVEAAAARHGVCVLEPKVLDQAFVARIAALEPDLIISTYYRRIMPRELLAVPRLGAVNVHPGLLPHYRGPIPTFWALINGEEVCGITVHFLDAGVDTGPIIDQTTIRISPRDTGYSVHLRAMRAGYRLLMKNIEAITRGRARARRQDASTGSYFGRFTERARYLDWRRGNDAVINLVRALTRPYAGALAITSDGEVVIWKVRRPGGRYPAVQPPGTIATMHHDGSFVVATSDGGLVVTEYEVPNLPPNMDATSFIRAHGRLL